MLPVGLNLKNKNVLIVGAGKVALRKAKLFLKEEASVTVVSKEFVEEFKDFNITCIHDVYQPKYLDGMFMVYVATNDKGLNQEIVNECDKRQLLCGSATKCEHVSFHSLAYDQNEVGMVALSTHQKMPYSKPILKELMAHLDTHQHQLSQLSLIRDYMVRQKNVNRDVLEKLYEVSEEILDFLVSCLETKKGYLYVYHQSIYPQVYHLDGQTMSLKDFETYKDIFEYFEGLTIVPLIVSDGYIYRKLSKMTSLNLLEPLVMKEEDVKTLISKLRVDGKINVWMMHPRSQNTLMEMFKNNVGREDMVQTFEEELRFSEGKEYHIVVLLMTKGEHYHELMASIPEGVSVSKILPDEKCVQNMLLKKEC